jgi:hypothetical protein
MNLPKRRLMKLSLRPFLLFQLLVLFIGSTAVAGSMESEVTDEQAHIWKTPGYTWRDCRPLEWKKFKDSYANPEDKIISKKRYESGGKEACLERKDERDLFKAEAELEVLTDSNGEPMTAINPKSKTDEFEVNIRGEPVKIQYYRVKSSTGVEGWMASSQMARPRPKLSRLDKLINYGKSLCKDCLKSEEEKEEEAKKLDPVLREARPDLGEVPKLQQSARDILEATNQQFKLGEIKSEYEMDRYMCIYRHRKKDLPDFLSELQAFKKAARDASNAFGMPYSMVMCTILIESRLRFDPQEIARSKEQMSRPPKRGEFIDKYLGLAQVGPELVADLQEAKESQPFKGMWEKYQAKNPDMKFTQHEVRYTADPRGALVAAAFAFRYLYDKRFPKQGCVGCSRDHKYNRKDLDMMVTGYNWGTGMLNKVKLRSSGQMRTSFPPPPETQNYMKFMESCMEKDYERTFRDQPSDLEKIKKGRQKQIKNSQQRIQKLKSPKLIEAEENKISKLRRQIATNVSPDLERNVAECDTHFPKKK